MKIELKAIEKQFVELQKVQISKNHYLGQSQVNAPAVRQAYTSPSNRVRIVHIHGMPFQIEFAGAPHAYPSQADTPTT